jgi:thioredoxin-related protein
MAMKFFFMLILVGWYWTCFAQEKGDVLFVKVTNWDAILQKAQLEHKYVFVDVYATWCGPCKQMDKEVYTSFEVRTVMDSNFVAIKVQMDSTRDDDEFVKKWHKEASKFRHYVTAYPTLLFFSPEGKLISRKVGYHDPEKFISILNKVIDSVNNYQAKANAFDQGTLNETELFRLAFDALENKDDRFALKVANAYKRIYVDAKDPKEILSPNLILFLNEFSSLFNIKNELIKYIYSYPNLLNKQTDINNFSQDYVQYIIRRDMFSKVRTENGEIITLTPNWSQIEGNIGKEFDPKLAKKVVLAEQIYFYWKKGDWNTQAKYEFEQIKFRGIDTSNDFSLNTVNDMIFNSIFKKEVSKHTLERAITYMEVLIKSRPNNYHFIDTYANVLYKAGYQKKAIKLQAQVINLARKDGYYSSLVYYQETLNKMKQGVPTWLVSASERN